MATNCIVTQYRKYVTFWRDLFSFRQKIQFRFLRRTQCRLPSWLYICPISSPLQLTHCHSPHKKKTFIRRRRNDKDDQILGIFDIIYYYIRYADNEIMSKMRVEHRDLNWPVHSVCRNKHFLISRLFYWRLTLEFRFQAYFMNLKKNCQTV